MSAESVIIYYGVKLPLSDKELESLEEKKHPYQIIAQEFSLNCYWGNFAYYGKEYWAFIGKELASMGCEHEWNQEIKGSELVRTITNTELALKKAGLQAEPKLLMHFQPNL